MRPLSVPTPRTSPDDRPPGTGSAAGSRIVLAEVRGRAEHDLARRWVAEHAPDAQLVRADPGRVARALAGADPDTEVTPVRVVWPPAPREGTEESSWSDVLSLSARRQALRRLHARVARWSTEKGRVVVGDPASLEELRRRHGEETGASGPTGPPAEALARFVLRRATLANDRAERRLTGDRYKVPRLMAEQITSSGRVAERAAALADELGMSTEEVLAGTADRLTEMAAVLSPPAIDVFRAVMSPLHARAWDVEVDPGGLERLRELGRTQPLVFLPAHRSYADPLVLAEVLHTHDFPRNHILGGDNLSFWPIGPLGKRAGIVFIRRSFGDDKIYKFAVREYLGHLMAKRFDLEWYIEGGRTRTGKLRPPKYGLLRYLVDGLEALDDPALDPVLVPVSIGYDQLHEVSALAAEQGGAGKKAEGLAWLGRYVRDQRRRIGSARVRFGEPFGLRGALADAGEGPAQLEKVAFAVATGINRATPVTPTALVTFALLGAGERALTFDQIRAVVDPLLALLAERGHPVADLDRDDGLAGTLAQLESVGVVERYDGGPETVWSIPSERHHVAAFYRNGALHHLLTRAVLEMTLIAVATSGRTFADVDAVVEACWTDALALRDLLKYEFFFSRKRVFRDELVAEVDLLSPDWRTVLDSASGASQVLRSARVLVAPRTLRPFVDAQLVVATVLAEHGDGPAPERSGLLDAAVGLGQQWWRQGRLQGADTVSRELFSTALRAADQRGLLGADDDGAAAGTDADDAPGTAGTGSGGLAARRAAWRDEVAAVRDRLVLAREREHELLEEVLGR